MSSLILDRVPRILQGAGALEQIGTVILELSAAGSVLLVADPGLKSTGMIEMAVRSLRAAGCAITVFDEVKSDPSMAQADTTAALARAQGARAVVALGGGSAMDLGKSVAAIAGTTHPASHYGLCANPFPAARLACVCVPTTSGTGSEATRTAVLSDLEGAKVWLWGDALKADAIVLDPTLTTGLPAHLTAATGIDALVHAIEASTNRNANPANDMYCHEAIRLVVAHLQRAVSAPQDLAARAGLQWAATFAGIGIDNCGTAIAHNIGHALASLRPIHHGRAVGVALRATLPWSVQGEDTAFAAAAAAMGEAADARSLPAAFDRLLREVGIKVSIAGEGHDDITPGELAQQMAMPANEPMRRSNRREVRDSDLLDFATAVLTER
ncbi:MAG: iron-containing alcohol dehydrogenase [Steroidobacterales bacterium]